MVQTEISHLATECNDWRETLRSHRDELHQMQTTLQQSVNRPLSKDEQSQLEHLQNQLHIQLINVHDLKHAVKLHDRKLMHKVAGKADGQFSDNVSAYHENLNDDYQMLAGALNELRSDLGHFITAIH